jgi:hypothetical protein
MLIKPHIVSTSAYIEDPIRISEYEDSYRLINENKECFESINIVETVSEKKLNYLENYDFNVYYSKLGNSHKNKGVNWLNHVTNFLIESEIPNEDIIIFITGRYRLINNNFLKLINKYMVDDEYEFIAKEDSDIYIGSMNGVHTFFMIFKKRKFLEFSSWYHSNGIKDNCIEWEVKNYLKTHDKTLILSNDFILGVETKIFDKTINNKIC